MSPLQLPWLEKLDTSNCHSTLHTEMCSLLAHVDERDNPRSAHPTDQCGVLVGNFRNSAERQRTFNVWGNACTLLLCLVVVVDKSFVCVCGHDR